MRRPPTKEGEAGMSWERLLLVVICWIGGIFVFHALRSPEGREEFQSHIPNLPKLGNSWAWTPSPVLKKYESGTKELLRSSERKRGPTVPGSNEYVERAIVAAETSLADLQSAMYYWRIDPLANSGIYRLPSMAGDRYVLFATDCGGFNNIRMGFEYAVFMAWLTRRVLVLPPPEGWYLIDFGPFARMKPERSAEHVTDFSEFFELEHLRGAIPVITTEEFRAREGERFNIPDKLRKIDLKTKDGAHKWMKWVLDEPDSELRVSLPWSPLENILYYPSKEAVDLQFAPEGAPKYFVHHRRTVELTREINERPMILFPSCKKTAAGENGENGFRYLVQVNTIAAFADEALSRSYKRMLRDNVHFRNVVFDIAARVVQFLGPFQFASLHVRRNDLQYKEVFIPASETLENVRALLQPNEAIYIATDEERYEEFFKPFVDQGFKIYRWADFFTAKGGNVLQNVYIPRKLEGCIEQVICAMARMFAGTLESTFTAYIFRLRGYYHAPNTEVYFHNLRYTGDLLADREQTYSKKPLKGQIYQSEQPSIWEDAESPHTTW